MRISLNKICKGIDRIWNKIKMDFEKMCDSVSFIADIVTPNISLRIIPPNHPYSKIFSQKNKLSGFVAKLTMSQGNFSPLPKIQ